MILATILVAGWIQNGFTMTQSLNSSPSPIPPTQSSTVVADTTGASSLLSVKYRSLNNSWVWEEIRNGSQPSKLSVQDVSRVLLIPLKGSARLSTYSCFAILSLHCEGSFFVPPKPRLVCVETNPGPGKGKKAVIVVKKGKKVNKVSVIKGRGDYSLFEAGGRMLGGLAGKALGSIFGSGAYAIKGNTLHTNSVPQFALTKNGNEFAHREFVMDIFSGGNLVSGATTFNLQQFIINPASDTLFPWIQQIAENFEMYELLGLIFEYVPASGDAVSSTNAALGTVIFATQYNSLDAPFTTKRQMESMSLLLLLSLVCP
jgi:hypothetical protein